MKKSGSSLVKVALCIIAAGIILTIIAYCFGASMRSYYYNGKRVDLVNFEQSYGRNTAESLTVDIDAGEVIIESGDEFRVSASYISESDFRVWSEDGVFYVSDTQTEWNRGFRLLPFIRLGRAPEIRITVPKDLILAEVEINIGAGSVKARNMDIGQLNVETGAGEFKGKDITVRNSGSISVDVGSAKLENFSGNNVELNCNVGSIRMDGDLTGTTEASCDMGEIKLELTRRESDYNYQVDCDMGNVIINNHKRSGFGNDWSNYSRERAHNLNLDCNLGSIRVETE
ncbi:DUF4097 family beta strand repeat-containing protein [Anaerolentibacter hominis]|uniref:DUF4097 family beta strand repeat-containing protein n=1 Tax=Anaerolentibacter hominis TaxID=3079009 RepID=UPI0031B831C6